MDRKTFFFGLVTGALLVIAVFMLVRETRPLPTDPTYRVSNVVDGDTLDVRGADGTEVRVRLVGIDTPETVDPNRRVECEGPEASARMKELLLEKNVSLEAKPDEDKDPYGRLLRYVFLSGKDIGAQMIEEGYAVSICKKFPHPRCNTYEELEKKAMQAKLGRWGKCAK